MRRLLAMATALGLLATACTSGGSTTTTVAGPAETSITTSTTLPAAAAEPVTSILDSGAGGVDYIGHMPNITIPPDGMPLVIYLSHDRAEEGSEDWVFNVAKCSDPTCSGDVSVTEFDVRNWGQRPAVTLGPDGLPVFVYLDIETDEEGRQRMTADPSSRPDDRLHLVRCLDAACAEHTETDLGPGQSASVVVPADNFPLVAFNELEENETVFLKCADADCDSSTPTRLQGGRFVFGAPLLLDPDGLPMLAFARNELLTEETAGEQRPGFVNVVYCNDLACSAVGDLLTVTETGENPRMIGCGLGPDGPVFAIDVHNQFEVVRCLDQACSSSGPASLIGPPRPRDHGSMVVDADGVPVLAYATDDGLAVAKCDDPDCTEGTIATLDKGWIFDLSMTLTEGGDPVIAYYAPPELKIVTCVDPGCMEGAIEVAAWDQETSVAEPPAPVGEVMAGWLAVPDPEGVFGRGGGGGMMQVLITETGLLAFGQECGIVEGSTGDCSAGVWASPDGLSWERVADLGPADVSAAVAGGPGFVAVGSTCTFGPAAPPADCAPAIWTSSEGREWQRVPHDEDLFPGCLQVDDPFCSLSVDGVVVLPGGDLLAHGYSAAGLTVWASPNGRTWTRTEEPFLPFGPDPDAWWVDGIITFGETVIATGGTCREAEVAYLGFSWNRNEDGNGVVVTTVEADSAAEAAGLEARDLIVVFDGEPVIESLSGLITAREPGETVTLTVLRDGDEIDLEATLGTKEDYFCSARLATSPDATVWTPIEGVLEADGDSWFGYFTEWAGGLLSVSEACDVAYNCESVVVTSPDGTTWESRPTGETLADVRLNRVFPFGDGLLGVGSTYDELLGESQGVFAVSTDGVDWALYATDPAVFGDHIGFSYLVELPGRLVAVGAGGGGPGVWVYEPSD